MSQRWAEGFPHLHCCELPFDTPVNGGLPALVGKYRSMGFDRVDLPEGDAKVYYLHHPDNVLMGMPLEKWERIEAERIAELREYQQSEARTAGISKLPDIEV